MDEPNDRRDLYEEFESEVVRRGNTEAFFDENDLVEIFDYASDYDNYIVKMEVLLYGAIHYPKSEALATRRAWLYYSFGDVEATSELNRRVGTGGVLNRLLDLRASNANLELGDEEVISALEKILDDTDDFDDEGIIQFTDYAMELRLESWLMQNKDRIQSKCSYPQTFLYEFADHLEENNDLPAAARLFEELTMLEPFNLDFWLRLATVQINNDDYEGALSSAEYALAINPESMMGLRIKGASLYRLERDPETVTAIYRRIVASAEAEDTDVSTLAAALMETNRQAEAVEMLTRYIGQHLDSRLAIDVLLVLDREKAAPYVRRLIASDLLSAKDTVEWARNHVVHGQFASAATVCLIYDEIKGFQEEIPFLIEITYFALRFDDVIRVYRDKFIKMKWPYLPALTYPYLMSLVRTGHRQEALDEAKEILNTIRTFKKSHTNSDLGTLFRLTPASTAAMITGYIEHLRNIIHALKAPEPIPADEFDPMLL